MIFHCFDELFIDDRELRPRDEREAEKSGCEVHLVWPFSGVKRGDGVRRGTPLKMIASA